MKLSILTCTCKILEQLIVEKLNSPLSPNVKSTIKPILTTVRKLYVYFYVERRRKLPFVNNFVSL